MFNAIPMACLSRFCVTKTLASEVSTTQCLTQVIEEQEALPSGSDGAAFDWLKQWYPLAVAEDLDPDRPHAEQLLGALLWSSRLPPQP